MTKVYHSQGKDDWGTPQSLFSTLDSEFHFDLDVAANVDNAKCPAFLTQEIDALQVDWWGRVWMNPPFTLLDHFLVKMIKELVAGHIEVGVALIASRTDTQAMFTASSYAGETRYLKGRVSFEVYPTPYQRNAAMIMSDIHIDPDGWPLLVKELGLPKTAIKALIKDPTLPGGHPSLSIGAPFPSTVLVFDRRPVQTTVYWDWKGGIRTVYVYGNEGVAQQGKGKGASTAKVVAVGPKGFQIIKVPSLFGSKLIAAPPVKPEKPLLEFIQEQEAKLQTTLMKDMKGTEETLLKGSTDAEEASDGTTGQG